VRIVALDTLIPGEPGGRLCAERLAWLEKTLAARRDAPTVVMLHHPPFDTLIGHMDRFPLEGREALSEVIARHPQVERVLCGHVHRRIEQRFAGTVASICPSAAHQVVLDLAGDAASAFNFEPPGFQLHAWTGQALVSHTASIGDFAGPYPFYTR
jgi:Icc protein